jgi:hypothetical protein
VGRTSMAVEAGAEKEQARGVDPAAVGEAVSATSRQTWRRSGRAAWTKRRSTRHRGGRGVGAGA